MGKLTLKRQAWLAEYLNCWNATEAARRVGFAEPNTQGPRLLLDVGIQEVLKAEITARTMGPEEVLSRLADIARGDVADLMALSTAGYEFELLIDDGQGNKIRNPKTKLIKKIRQKVTIILGKKESDEDRQITETELELYAADDAIMDIAKLNGMISDRTENLNIDLSTLTDEQFDRLYNGEKLASVLRRSKV